MCRHLSVVANVRVRLKRSNDFFSTKVERKQTNTSRLEPCLANVRYTRVRFMCVQIRVNYFRTENANTLREIKSKF